MSDDREEQARKHLRTWSHLSDTGAYVEGVFTRVCAERDAAIARAEAAEALAASRPEITPDTAYHLARWLRVEMHEAIDERFMAPPWLIEAEAALRAHAAKAAR